MVFHMYIRMSNEKKPKVIKGNCLIILHSYMGIKTIHYKDPY